MKKRYVITALAVVALHLFFRSVRFSIPAYYPGQDSQWMAYVLVAASRETRAAFRLGFGNEWVGMIAMALIASVLVFLLPWLSRRRREMKALPKVRTPEVSRRIAFRLFMASGLILLLALTMMTIFAVVSQMRSPLFIGVCLTLAVGLLIGLIYGVAWFERRNRLDPPRA